MNFNIDDLITTDGYLNIVERYPENLCHIKTDFFKIGHFIWRGEDHPKILKKNVIISHSDYSVDDKISSRFDKVFCVNNDSKNNNTYSLPLGIPNYNIELDVLSIIGDKIQFYNKMNERSEKQIIVYMNFTVQTHKNLRSGLIDHFSKFPWVYWENSDLSINGRLRYLDNIKKSKFVLCPRGNGLDTHRLWETLYLGSIPIIERYRTHDICEDLPVLFVDRWEDLNEHYLNKKYDEIINKEYNLQKLKMSYWEDFIIKKIKNYV